VRRSVSVAALIAPALAAVLAPSAALSGAVPVANGIGTWEVPVESMTKMRFRSVVAQQYDFSCGSAALATLLTFHYGREVPESVAFDGMFRVGDQETIRQQGFSMLDMKRYLESEHGLAADGFHVKLSDLKELGVPGIVMIETRGYRHFVVVKGVGDERVLVGDPAYGLRSYSHSEFEHMLANDIVFIVRDELDTARRSFNDEGVWAAVAHAPTEEAVPRPTLSSLTLHLPSYGW
jgi:predicted double-glycine peptidase